MVSHAHEDARRRTRVGSKRNVDLPVLSPDTLRRDLYEHGTLWNTSVRGVLLCNGARGVDDCEYWLSYMPMRNRAEVIRLMLAYANVPYAFEVVGYERWNEVKPAMNFGKTPALVDVDGGGTDLTHETAMTRYLADKLNLGGSDSFQKARVDELFSQYWHTIRNNGLTHAGELYSANALKDASAEDVENCGRFQDTHRVNALSVAKRSLQALRVFEEIFETNGTPYLVGDDPTYVDFALFDALFDLGEEDATPDFAERFRLPRCGEFANRVAGIPTIDAYLRSPTRIPRYERPEYAYVSGRFSPEP